jgi:hypothetical protein
MFMDTMSIPLDPIALVAIGVLAWSLLGLWLWMNFDDSDGGSGLFFRFMFTLFCGPAAWLTATWKATHRPRRRRDFRSMKAEEWTWPDNWRN